MTMACPGLPATLTSRLFHVDRPLLVERYREALQRLNGRVTLLASFHVDAAGYSPQIAAELADPFYMGHGAMHPAFTILSVDQLDCPVLQPNAGFSWMPYRRWISALRAELADLTLREPVFGEITHGVTRFGHPGQLGLVRGLSLAVHTPSERLTHALDLGAMKAALVEGEADWRDEVFLERMLERARHARGWVEVPAALKPGRHIQAGPTFAPAFGGCYVWPGHDAREPVAWVLCRATTPEDAETWPALAEAAGVLLLPLNVDTATEFLVERQLSALRAPAAAFSTAALDELQTWIALDHLARGGRLTPEASADPRRVMRSEAEPPPDYLELEDLRLCVQSARGDVDLARFSALTRLRVMPVLAGDETDRAWVCHLRAFLDPVQVPRTVRHASDLALGLVSNLCAEMAHALDRQLAAEEAA